MWKVGEFGKLIVISSSTLRRWEEVQIIQWAIQGEVKVLYVAHKDRLCRFGFELVEQILQWSGGKIVVANAGTLSPQEELTQDLLSIVNCFSSRLYGLRKYKSNAPENCRRGRSL